MKRLMVVACIALLALAFGPVHLYAQGKVVRITLIDENGSGEDGSAQLTDQGTSTKVELLMLNAPEGVVQPAGVFKGTCASLDKDQAFPLQSVTESKSTSTVNAPLADLTKEKYAIAVFKSETEKIVYSCGNLPSAAAVSGQAMTLEQVTEQLLDNANELLGTIKKKEADASQHAYDTYHATFAAHEEEIKAKSAQSQAKLEEAMHGVRDALQTGDFSKAETAAEELVNEVKAAQAVLSSGAGATDLMATVDKLKSAAMDVQRETKNKDVTGSQAAYDEFHTLFAANEEAIKEKNAEAQEHIEEAMHEVRDALQAKDFTKASAAADELVKEVTDAAAELSGATSTSTTSTTSTTTSPATGSLAAAVQQIKDAAIDVQREVKNKDVAGSQAAYNDFHTLFAANEDAIKARNAEAQEHLESAMHEVRDALAAGDFAKAATAADELVMEATDAVNEFSGAAAQAPLPTSGASTLPMGLLAWAAVASALVAAGTLLRRRIARR
jgi:hypothetical protein